MESWKQARPETGFVRQRPHPSPTWSFWAGVAFLIVAGAVLVLNWAPVMEYMTSLDFLTRESRQRALLIMTMLLALQVVIPPLPGAPLVAGAAAVFGFWPVWLYGFTGIFIGSVIAYGIGLLVGRPALERFASDDFLAKMEGLKSRYGDFVVVGVFLVPFTADDAMCILAGMWRFPFWRFILAVLIGRLPSVLLWAKGGTMLKELSWAAIAGLVALVGAIAYVIHRRFAEL